MVQLRHKDTQSAFARVTDHDLPTDRILSVIADSEIIEISDSDSVVSCSDKAGSPSSVMPDFIQERMTTPCKKTSCNESADPDLTQQNTKHSLSPCLSQENPSAILCKNPLRRNSILQDFSGFTQEESHTPCKNSWDLCNFRKHSLHKSLPLNFLEEETCKKPVRHKALSQDTQAESNTTSKTHSHNSNVLGFAGFTQEEAHTPSKKPPHKSPLFTGFAKEEQSQYYFPSIKRRRLGSASHHRKAVNGQDDVPSTSPTLNTTTTKVNGVIDSCLNNEETKRTQEAADLELAKLLQAEFDAASRYQTRNSINCNRRRSRRQPTLREFVGP